MSLLDFGEVNVDELKSILNTGKDITLIDVRTSGEYMRGHLPGSINIPLDQLQTIRKRVPDVSQKLYVYCFSGSRSNQAVPHFSQMGYRTVINVKNGVLAWRVKYPLVT